jgi:hypothetical protein
MPLRKLSLLAAVLVIAGSALAQPVAFNELDGALEITVAGRRVATYVWADADLPRPYFANLRTLDGIPITRTHPPDPKADAGNDDHATYHPGVWLAFGDLGGVDFWRNKARVRHVRFTEPAAIDDGVLRLSVLNAYETRDDPPRVLCEETARYTLRLTAQGYLLACESVFTPKQDGLAFGDQEEMGFGIRLATPLTVKHGQGQIWNSEGGQNEAGTWGQTAAWCAGGAEVGGKHIGAVVIPALENFRPAWFHSRDYGLIVANPFGVKAMTGPDDDRIPPASTPMTSDFRLGFAIGVFSTETGVQDAVEALVETYTGSR